MIKNQEILLERALNEFGKDNGLKSHKDFRRD